MARAVVALGGNAILPKDAEESKDVELQAIQETVEHLQPVLDEYDTVLTHGNGPQVGTLLLQQRYTDAEMPLDVLVAETQAQIGYLLQQEIQNHGIDAATVVTQVEVDADDPWLDTYTKPVGPYYTEEEAAEKAFETTKVSDGDRPYRRVVPSPTPEHIVETEQIQTLLEQDTVPVCVGGGGIPVIDTEDGFEGMEAVIDKDRASALIAGELSADLLVILTNVEHAYRHYGEDNEEPLETVTADTLQKYLNDRAFGAGNMRPKVEACISFIHNGGKQAIITTPARLEDALNGTAGTRVVHDA